ncbi:hypothetical protein FNV43_RR18396 [Rhamnella rubrinervis]|uniref:Uncharacterized protein n=1 Tax=Rhamnella rubrinervis TaxID=2594499 RepID=A0A8K0E517_9ROSA|nr:hypothetical protein FNV43_RR18396 [Rhamnella rubrinervis]
MMFTTHCQPNSLHRFQASRSLPMRLRGDRSCRGPLLNLIYGIFVYRDTEAIGIRSVVSYPPYASPSTRFRVDRVNDSSILHIISPVELFFRDSSVFGGPHFSDAQRSVSDSAPLFFISFECGILHSRVLAVEDHLFELSFSWSKLEAWPPDFMNHSMSLTNRRDPIELSQAVPIDHSASFSMGLALLPLRVYPWLNLSYRSAVPLSSGYSPQRFSFSAEPRINHPGPFNACRLDREWVEKGQRMKRIALYGQANERKQFGSSDLIANTLHIACGALVGRILPVSTACDFVLGGVSSTSRTNLGSTTLHAKSPASRLHVGCDNALFSRVIWQHDPFLSRGILRQWSRIFFGSFATAALSYENGLPSSWVFSGDCTSRYQQSPVQKFSGPYLGLKHNYSAFGGQPNKGQYLGRISQNTGPNNVILDGLDS